MTPTTTEETAPMPDDFQTLTGHTLAEHGKGGPVRHAWRCGWSDPHPILEEQGQPARTRVPLDLTEHGPDDEQVAMAVCGVALPHRVAQPFNPDEDRACADCARVLATTEDVTP